MHFHWFSRSELDKIFHFWLVCAQDIQHLWGLPEITWIQASSVRDKKEEKESLRFRFLQEEINFRHANQIQTHLPMGCGLCLEKKKNNPLELSWVSQPSRSGISSGQKLNWKSTSWNQTSGSSTQTQMQLPAGCGWRLRNKARSNLAKCLTIRSSIISSKILYNQTKKYALLQSCVYTTTLNNSITQRSSQWKNYAEPHQTLWLKDASILILETHQHLPTSLSRTSERECYGD